MICQPLWDRLQPVNSPACCGAQGTDQTGMDFRRGLPEIRCQPGLSPPRKARHSPPAKWFFDSAHISASLRLCGERPAPHP